MLNVAVTISPNNDLFTVQSNSTIANLSFNTTLKELAFTVSGTSGTSGYAKIAISKTLVPNGNDIKLTLDGENLTYRLSPTETSWILMFTYHHSSHQIVADLNIKQSSTVDSDNLAWIIGSIALLAALVVGAAVVLRKRRVKKE
jgi:MYXO-CTERM domain-containing protein